jgi:multidrug efflux pump subunit AcrB
VARNEVQWDDIRAAWISTDKPIREMAREFGASEANIRKRAAKEAWGPRNASARKRAIVEAALAGAQSGAQCAPRTETDAAIQNEADQDIADMRLAASVGRKALQRCQHVLDLVNVDEEGKDPPTLMLIAPKDIKAIAEAARAALEVIRRARNLDDPKKDLDEASPLLSLAASIREARAARPQTT